MDKRISTLLTQLLNNQQEPDDSFVEEVEDRANSICLELRKNEELDLTDSQIVEINKIITAAEILAFGHLNSKEQDFDCDEHCEPKDR